MEIQFQVAGVHFTAVWGNRGNRVGGVIQLQPLDDSASLSSVLVRFLVLPRQACSSLGSSLLPSLNFSPRNFSVFPFLFALSSPPLSFYFPLLKGNEERGHGLEKDGEIAQK